MGILDAFLRLGQPKELLITDVTRMQGDRVCVAGLVGKNTVRLAEPAPTRQLLKKIGGLASGDVIGVDWNRLSRYRPPHTEDCRWRPTSALRRPSLEPEALYSRLAPAAFGSVHEAFGKPKFLARKGNPAFPSDKGKRSLATISATNVRVYRFGDCLRAEFEDSETSWRMLPVESIAIRDHFKVCSECKRTGETRAESALLRVGLGRPFQPDGEQLGCFAQVNAVVSQESGSHFKQENNT